jgi:hypothetical protein
MQARLNSFTKQVYGPQGKLPGGHSSLKTENYTTKSLMTNSFTNYFAKVRTIFNLDLH